jgi:hypothetical protein
MWWQRKRNTNARPPWELGLSDEEREKELRTQQIVRAYLSRPHLRKITLADHGPFNLQSLTCLNCGKGMKTLLSFTMIPECRR